MPILKHILVATDLSPAGYRAVMRAGQLAHQWEASLHIIHVKPDWNLYARWKPASNEAYQDIAHSHESALSHLLARLEADFGVHARCETRLGRASSVIAKIVAELDPHLVLVGARGEHDSPESGPHLGGTAFKLLNRSEHPLLLVRGLGAARYTSSLVAIDAASPLARRLVLWGSGFVPGGDCHIVHVYDLPYVERMRLRGVSDAVIDARLRHAREHAGTVAGEVLGAKDDSARMQIHAVRGEPVAAVLAETAKQAPQLVVVGKRHAHSPQVQAGAMGGVALRIAYHAPGDVLVLS